MDTSIIITSTDAYGKKRKRSITDINPNATNTQLHDFAQQINLLTSNRYETTTRVDKINVDSETDEKQFCNLQTENIAPGSTTATVTYTITANTTPTPLIFFYNQGNITSLTSTFQPGETDTQGKAVFTIPNSTGYLYIGFLENASFYSELILVEVSN